MHTTVLAPPSKNRPLGTQSSGELSGDAGLPRDPSRAPRPLTPLRALRNVALFMIFLCAFFAIENHFVPYPCLDMMRDKLEYFQRHKDEYDVVFVGSSLIHTQLDPLVFDDVLAREGHRVKTFNLAVAGSYGYDISAMTNLILDMRPARLKILVTDYRNYDPAIQTPFTQSVVWYHDWEMTRMALRQISNYFPLRGTFIGKALACEKMLRSRLQHMFLYYSNLGMGTTIFHNMTEPTLTHERRIEATGNARGFLRRDGPPYLPKDAPYRQIYLKNLEHFRKFKGADPKVPRPAKFPDKRPLKKLSKTTRAHGIDLIVVFPPRVDLERYYPWLKYFRNNFSGFINLSDPDRYGALYATDLRWPDGSHLNVKGSRMFTVELAKQFSPFLSKRGL